ncbi:MAG TPA: Lrp/AsnC family transcriptional regulator [Thermoanaerobaculia bacterium]|nr:Lrp/AsnC family transcriptional regulator [Thermoanaerobaculia bacterium]
MAVEVDEVDLHIIDVLLRDGRLPSTELADIVGLSRSAVGERVARLERSGVIRGTTIVLDPATLGRTITAFVSCRGTISEAKAKKTFEALMKSDEVVEAHTVAGDDCYLIKVRTASIAALNTLVSKLNSPPLSLSTRTTIVMKTHFEKCGGVTLGEDR